MYYLTTKNQESLFTLEGATIGDEEPRVQRSAAGWRRRAPARLDAEEPPLCGTPGGAEATCCVAVD